jgi:nucleoside-diphosphate-sugar epimerase
MIALVTGAAGFIGHHLVQALLSQDDEVVGVDSLVNGSMDRVEPFLARFPRQYKFYKLDLLDAGMVTELFTQKFDCVFHLAALGSVPRSIADPICTMQNNVLSTAHALWLSHRSGVKRFVYSSSASVYGNAGLDKKDEAFYLEPTNPYGVSKLAAEKMVKVFWSVYNLPTVSLRYFNVFGPGQTVNSPYAAVIPGWLSALEQDEPMTIYGDGEQRRDFTYVSNVVEANLLAVTTDEESFGEEFNVGCGRLTSVNELSALVGRYWGPPAVVKYAPARKGDIRTSSASMAKSGVVLGYQPRVQVEEGIQKTVEWFRRRSD